MSDYKSVNREKYFFLMKDFTTEVKSSMQGYLELYCPDKTVLPILNFFIDKRIKNPCWLKPFLTKLSYEVVGGSNIAEVIPIAVAAEIVNISSYQANSVLDGKYGIFTKSDKDNQLIAAMITIELVDKIISGTSLNLSVKDRIKSLYSDANSYIYYGQFYEFNTLSLKNLDFNSLDINTYLEIYIRRLDYISGIFSRNVALAGALLATDDESKLVSIGEYAWNFGIGLGIINDISDYLPSKYLGVLPSYKTSVDQYCDVRNGKIFLPVFYALKNGNRDQQDYILEILRNGREFNESGLMKLTSILYSTGAFDFALLVAKKYINLAKKYRHQLPKTPSRDLLSVMASLVSTSKYVYFLKNINLQELFDV